jgi:hypothetical protein
VARIPGWRGYRNSLASGVAVSHGDWTMLVGITEDPRHGMIAVSQVLSILA